MPINLKRQCLAKNKNRQYADEMRIANEEKQCLLTSLRLLSKESTNNSQHELANVDLIAENKSLHSQLVCGINRHLANVQGKMAFNILDKSDRT